MLSQRHAQFLDGKPRKQSASTPTVVSMNVEIAPAGLLGDFQENKGVLFGRKSKLSDMHSMCAKRDRVSRGVCGCSPPYLRKQLRQYGWANLRHRGQPTQHCVRVAFSSVSAPTVCTYI